MKNDEFRFGIVGCGLIGKKRARALKGIGRVVACADMNINAAQSLAVEHGAQVYKDWQELVQSIDVDVVIVATLHDSLSEISYGAIKAGKHVLVEKPAGRTATEIEHLIAAEQSKGVKVHVGFNHRYHRALIKAKELVSSGQLGRLMYIRARYGHGGRIGYEKEWRADFKRSGGGELIDQGPHLIDLSRWFMGEFTHTSGFASTFFWDMPVDDNGFMLLKTAENQVAFLHASCTEWKNLFSLEIYGQDGKIEVSGLGGSYGLEKITFYKMLPEMGPPETTSWEYPMSDNSWSVELEEFIEDIKLDRKPAAGLADALAALQIIEKIYKDSGYDYYA